MIFSDPYETPMGRLTGGRLMLALGVAAGALAVARFVRIRGLGRSSEASA